MKKIITIIAALILSLALAFSASAGNAGISAANTSEDITVTISLNGDMENITNFEYSLYFNADSLTLKSEEIGNSCDKTQISALKHDANGSYYSVSFVDTTSCGVTIRSGVIAKFVFSPTAHGSFDFRLVKESVLNSSFEYIDDGSVTDGMVTITVAGAYSDVRETDWFYPYVEYVSARGIMNGSGDGRFDPYGTLNRAMLVSILYRAEGTPDCSGLASPFKDVKAGSWYENAVKWAYANGIVSGISAVQYAPETDITREQMAAILFRYAAFKGFDTSARADISAFSDGAKVSPWAAEAMRWANGTGLINGRGGGILAPTDTASRAEAATILMQFLEKY